MIVTRKTTTATYRQSDCPFKVAASDLRETMAMVVGERATATSEAEAEQARKIAAILSQAIADITALKAT